MNKQIPHESNLCGAKTRSGQPCRKHPVAGRKRCRLHGGATPRGTAHPNFKNGLYSKELESLRERLKHLASEQRKGLLTQRKYASIIARVKLYDAVTLGKIDAIRAKLDEIEAEVLSLPNPTFQEVAAMFPVASADSSTANLMKAISEFKNPEEDSLA